MSSVEKVVQNSNELFTNYETSKLLLGNNEFTKGSLTASGNTELTEGLVMGRISATGAVVVMDKDATNGSQYPVGVCIKDQTVLDGETAELVLVNKGRVNENKISFGDDETLDTAVGVANNQKIYRDWLNDLGLVLIDSEELTGYDNYL
jgi:hypothetical protein